MIEKRITQIEHPPGFIDLGSGNPDPGLFPLGLLQSAAERYFSTSDPLTLQYGAEQGNGNFLTALSDFLTSATRSFVDPHSLFTTTGASSALDLLCTLNTRSGDVILVEEPTYFLALRIFADHGLKVVPIPMDEYGLQVDLVDDMAERYKPKFIYTIPTFHNPSSWTLSQSRRDSLVRLAQKHNLLIIADEVYHFLAYTQTPPQPFASFSKDVEQVVSINSFSKILASGLRLGWIQAHATMIKQLAGCGLLDSGGGMNPFTAAIMYYLIDSGDLTRNITNLRKVYLKRLSAMTTVLDQYLPEAEYSVPRGGFFTWVRFPEKNTTLLRHQAQRFNIDIRPGELFSIQNGLKEYLRLSFSYYSPSAIEKGIMELAKCLGA